MFMKYLFKYLFHSPLFPFFKSSFQNLFYHGGLRYNCYNYLNGRRKVCSIELSLNQRDI